MDYEKKYKDAIADMKVIYPNLKGDAKRAVEHAFPELKESEDEKRRKQIEQALIEHDWSATYKVSKDDCLAYLEKQKEQKPTDDKAFEEWIDDWYQGSKGAGGCVVMSEAEFKNWSRGIRNMYQQKPAEWSEEDEKMHYLLAVINEPNNAGSESCHLVLKGLYEQLKKLM